MSLLTKILALTLSATTLTASLPIPLTSRSDSATCYSCGKFFASSVINIAIDRFCVNGLQGFPSAQQVFDYLFYPNNGGMGSLALGIRATGAEVTNLGYTYRSVRHCKCMSHDGAKHSHFPLTFIGLY